MSTKIVLEPASAPYDPALYRATPNPTRPVDTLDAVSDTEIAAYRQQGYLWVRDALSSTLVARVRAELEAMAVAEDPDCASVTFEGLIRDHLTIDAGRDRIGTTGRADEFVRGQTTDQIPELDPAVRAQFVRKFQGFVDEHPSLAALANLPELVALVRRLIGGPERLFQDMALVKPPCGREKPWHQDHAYFNLPLATPIVGVWIPLHPVNQANGCMHILPGSHQHGPKTHFMRRDWQICDSEILGHPQHFIAMDPGDVLLFDAKLAHGTPTNETAQMRWAVQYHYVPADVRELADSDRLAVFGSEGKDVSC
ncbi:MAG: phytanoyl-CoA dioxygenase family protein [Alphaproteobacteria bacterium]